MTRVIHVLDPSKPIFFQFHFNTIRLVTLLIQITTGRGLEKSKVGLTRSKVRISDLSIGETASKLLELLQLGTNYLYWTADSKISSWNRLVPSGRDDPTNAGPRLLAQRNGVQSGKGIVAKTLD